MSARTVLIGLALLCAAPAAVSAPLAPFFAIGGSIAGAMGATYVSAAFMIASLAASAYGSVEARRDAARDARRARDAYNASLSDRTITTLTADPPWRIVYGRAIVGGDILGIFTSDKVGYRLADGLIGGGANYTKPDAYKHIVVAVAAHQVQAINDVLIDGISVGTLDGSGWPTAGEFYRTEPEWRQVTIAAGGSVTVPDPVVTVVNAYSTEGSGADAVHTDVAVTLSGGNTIITNPAPSTVWVNYTCLTGSGLRGTVRIQKHLGTDDQAADSFLMSVCPSEWTANDRLRGIAYLVVTLDLEETRFQGGPPGITVDVTGRLLFDPRTGTSAWSDNPALIARDWITAAWGLAVPAAEVDDATVIAAANACDGYVALFGGPLWRANGAVTTADDRERVLDDICASMAGYAYASAQWVVMAGVWSAPVMTLGDSQLAGQISIQQVGGGIDDTFNGVRTRFIPASSAVVTEGDPYQNASFVAADGRELWTDVTLPFVDSRDRAKSIARILTERARDGMVITYPAQLHAFGVQVGDRVSINSAEYGWAGKTFRVTDWQFGVQTPVMLTLQEDAAAVWDLADAATSDPAPNTGLPSPWAVAALSGVAAASGTAHLIRSADGTVSPRVWVSWSAVSDPYVTDPAGKIMVRWLRPGAEWAAAQTSGDAVGLYVGGVREGDRLVIEAWAVNGIGGRGPKSFVAHTVIGKSQAPADVTGLAAAMIEGGILVSWTGCPDIDYAETELRYGASWAAGTLIWIGSAVRALWPRPPEGSYTIWAKHRDSSGNESATAASTAIAAMPAPGTALVATSNITVVGSAATKTAGPDTTWLGSVYSRDGFTGGAFVTFRPARTDKDLMVGLNTDPTTDAGYASIDYALNCRGSGDLYAYESGTGVSLGVSYGAGDALAVTYDGVNVRYAKNGAVLRTVAATISSPLYADSAFYEIGAAITSLEFGPMSAVTNIGTSQLQLLAATLVLEASTGEMSREDFHATYGYWPAGSLSRWCPVGFELEEETYVILSAYVPISYDYDGTTTRANTAFDLSIDDWSTYYCSIERIELIEADTSTAVQLQATVLLDAGSHVASLRIQGASGIGPPLIDGWDLGTPTLRVEAIKR